MFDYPVVILLSGEKETSIAEKHLSFDIDHLKNWGIYKC